MMRKKRPAITGVTASKKIKQSRMDCVFHEFVTEAGVTLKEDASSIEITVDQVIFQKRIQQQLQRSPRYPGIIQEFISGLEAYIENNDRFRNCLLPCVPQMSEGHISIGSFQESLLRMLLGIENLQAFLISTLLDKLPEFMLNNNDDGGPSIPHLIINQLKWLDRIVKCKELAEKLMELVSVAPVEIQRNIITTLPEILEDSQHNDVARELNSILQENTQLIVPVLDALSSLNLASSLLKEVRSVVMGMLAAVQLEDLPVVVKFILHSVTASDANEVVCSLRKKLDLEQCVLPPVLQASQSRLRSRAATFSSASTSVTPSGMDSICLTLEGIRNSVRFQKSLSEAWLKAIEVVEQAAEHKVIDLLLLFILHSTNANHSRRNAEKVLKLKVRKGLFREALLQKTFRDYPQVLRNYFPSILALAQSLLRSPDSSVVPFGGLVYRHSFTEFDSYCQQEVVGSLITHVCSGVSGEVDIALELLCGLATEKPSEMAQYVNLIKGILDYMDNLMPQQIRRVFHFLSSMFFSQSRGSLIQDEIHMVIRKQLSSTVPKYKRIGIVGAVIIAGSMASCRQSSRESQDEKLSDDTLKQVKSLLEMVRSSSESSPEAAALYYDELANLISTSTLKSEVEVIIRKDLLTNFEEDFVVEQTNITGSFPFPVSVMYSLDDERSQGNIAINLLPLLAKDLQDKGKRQTGQRQNSPLCLSPFFRLLRLSEEKLSHGNLDELGAILGCPVILTNMDVVEKMESLSKADREFICSLLFHALNWFREVLNGFCKQTEPATKNLVVTRLQNITYLQTLLERALAETPGYVPPVCNFDGDVTEGVGAVTTPPTSKPKKAGASRKRKAPGKNSPETVSQVEEATEADESQQKKSEKKEEVDLNSWPEQPEKDKEVRSGTSMTTFRPFFRELDIEVLSLLERGFQSSTELHDPVQKEAQLGPGELVFLLDDMLHKLEMSLTAVCPKQVPFFKSKVDKGLGLSHLKQRSAKDIVSFCVQLLPAICELLESCHNYFQDLLSENNSVVDGPHTDLQEYQQLSTVYQLLLQILRTLFSWSGFSQPALRGLLKEALGIFAGRIKADAELSLDKLAKHSIEYLLNLQSTVPNLSTALSLTQLISAISENGGDSADSKKQIASVAQQFLKQVWISANGERERGIKFREALHILLSIYLAHVDDVLMAVEEIVEKGISELINGEKDENSSTWPTLNRQTLLVFYKVLLSELEKAVRKIPAVNINDSHEAQTRKLLQWDLAVRDLYVLVNNVKFFESRAVLNHCLKFARLFLETFLKLGMPLLDYAFKRHKDDVQRLLKTFQLSTRQLHHMCGHSKIHQDTNLTNNVPALKKSLELFVYRVKAMLAINNCQEAFWIGTLKNRNLKGEEILSQKTQESEEEEEGLGSPCDQSEEDSD